MVFQWILLVFISSFTFAIDNQRRADMRQSSLLSKTIEGEIAASSPRRLPGEEVLPNLPNFEMQVILSVEVIGGDKDQPFRQTMRVNADWQRKGLLPKVFGFASQFASAKEVADSNVLEHNFINSNNGIPYKATATRNGSGFRIVVNQIIGDEEVLDSTTLVALENFVVKEVATLEPTKTVATVVAWLENPVPQTPQTPQTQQTEISQQPNVNPGTQQVISSLPVNPSQTSTSSQKPPQTQPQSTTAAPKSDPKKKQDESEKPKKKKDGSSTDTASTDETEKPKKKKKKGSSTDTASTDESDDQSKKSKKPKNSDSSDSSDPKKKVVSYITGSTQLASMATFMGGFIIASVVQFIYQPFTSNELMHQEIDICL